MIKIILSLLILAFIVPLGKLYAKIKVEKNINYTDNTDRRKQLNVYYKTGVKKPQDVIIFIHGGSWSTGKKEIYWWLARNLARKEIIAVTINYRLAPIVQFGDMALDVAEATKWVGEHIAEYGGNKNRIFLMGHSAGGHLAELINTDPQYFAKLEIINPIKGLILNDPFGLDMLEYMSSAEKDDSYNNFLRTFTNDPKIWALGSPLHYVNNVTNSHLIFYGARTYPSIQIQSERLNKTLIANHVKSQLRVIKGKKHVGMITQMILGSNSLYDTILQFLNATPD